MECPSLSDRGTSSTHADDRRLIDEAACSPSSSNQRDVSLHQTSLFDESRARILALAIVLPRPFCRIFPHRSPNDMRSPSARFCDRTG